MSKPRFTAAGFRIIKSYPGTEKEYSMKDFPANRLFVSKTEEREHNLSKKNYGKQKALKKKMK